MIRACAMQTEYGKWQMANVNAWPFSKAPYGQLTCLATKEHKLPAIHKVKKEFPAIEIIYRLCWM